MKNVKVVQTMTTEELNAEYKGLQKVAQDIINPTSGWINPDGLTGDLQKYQAEVDQRIDLLVQEIADRERKEYTAQLSIGRGTLASTMVLTVAFQKNRDIALASLIEKIIADNYELALQMQDILDEQIQAKDDALIGEGERNYEDRTANFLDEMMDGDPVSALASIGWGTDEDYGGDDRI